MAAWQSRAQSARPGTGLPAGATGRRNTDAPRYLIQGTFIALDNTYGGDVILPLYFVNENCTSVDNQFVLTHNQPIYWSAATGHPAGFSPWGVLGDRT